MALVTKPFDLGNTLARAAQISGFRNQNRLAELQLGQAEAGLASENRINEVLAAGGPEMVNQLTQLGLPGISAARDVTDLKSEVSKLRGQELDNVVDFGRLVNTEVNAILSSNNPRQRAELALKNPVIGERFGNVDLASLSDEQLLSQMQDIQDETEFFNQPDELSRLISGQAAIDQGFAPGSVVEETVDPSGRVTDRSVLQKPPQAGIEVSVDPEGGVSFKQGGPATNLSKPTRNLLEKEVLNAQAGLVRLKNIGAAFKPEFLTIAGKAKRIFQRGKEIAGFELDDAEKQFLTEFTTFKIEALKNLNLYIKSITGAAMSVQEAARIVASMPNEDMAPTEFQATFGVAMKELNTVQARSMHALKNGIDPLQIPLTSMSGVIDARGAVLKERFAQGGLEGDALTEAVKNQLRSEFGLQ